MTYEIQAHSHIQREQELITRNVKCSTRLCSVGLHVESLRKKQSEALQKATLIGSRPLKVEGH